MVAVAGRALRVKYDSGAGLVAIVGETSGNFSINKEGINITDKDDAGVQTFINDAVGVWSMEIGFEGIVKDDTILAIMADESQFTYDFEVEIAGIGAFAGKFGITNYNPTGAEGAEAVTASGTLVSSGTITYTAAI